MLGSKIPVSQHLFLELAGLAEACAGTGSKEDQQKIKVVRHEVVTESGLAFPGEIAIEFIRKAPRQVPLITITKAAFVKGQYAHLPTSSMLLNKTTEAEAAKI